MPEQLLLWPDHDPAPALSVWERLGMWMVGECEWPAEVGPERRAARIEAGNFALAIWNACDRVVIENPRGGLTKFIPDADLQDIQPYQFGEDASKATCLRLKNMPRLQPAEHVAPRMVNGKQRWSNQTDSGQNRLSPGPNRWKDRSQTYQGIADAMADQWSKELNQ
jgi:hypothetical protein